MGSTGNNIDPIVAIRTRLANMSEAEQIQFKKETGFDISTVHLMRFDLAQKYCETHGISLSTTETIWAKKRDIALQNAQYMTNDIAQSVKGWYIEKEKAKNVAEEEYYAALGAYELAQKTEDKAASELSNYTEGDTFYSDYYKKWDKADKNVAVTDSELSAKRDKFNFANFAALKAFFVARDIT